ncbi:MAG: O-antigen ligase family protein [Eubacterium sp.]|nr:O-antigen ligase family protein [Eubacterium sp.]
MGYTIKIGNGIRNVYWPIVGIIVIQRYITPEVFFLLNVMVLAYIVANARSVAVNPMWGYWILVLFVVWGMLAGIQSLNVDHLRDYFRDIYYYVNPLVFLANGVYFAKMGISKSKYINSLIIGNLIHVLIFDFQIVMGWDYGGISGYLMVPMALLLLNDFDEKNSFGKKVRACIILLYIVPFAIAFSRTSIIVVLVIYLFCALKKESIRKIPKIFAGGCVLLVVLAAIFNNVLDEELRDRYVGKIENSFNEISFEQNWDDPNVVTKNWRGYEVHCAIEEFKQGNPFQQVFGFGFSKKVDVGVYSYMLLELLDENGRHSTTIAVMHNGYANVLMKLGVLGVVMLLFFYINIIVKAMKKEKVLQNGEGRILAGCVLALLFMTYILNGMFKDVCYYSLVTTIGFFGYRVKVGQRKVQEKSLEC